MAQGKNVILDIDDMKSLSTGDVPNWLREEVEVALDESSAPDVTDGLPTCGYCDKAIPEDRMLAVIIPEHRYRLALSPEQRTILTAMIPLDTVKWCSDRCKSAAKWTRQNERRATAKPAAAKKKTTTKAKALRKKA